MARAKSSWSELGRHLAEQSALNLKVARWGTCQVGKPWERCCFQDPTDSKDGIRFKRGARARCKHLPSARGPAPSLAYRLNSIKVYFKKERKNKLEILVSISHRIFITFFTPMKLRIIYFSNVRWR